MDPCDTVTLQTDELTCYCSRSPMCKEAVSTSVTLQKDSLNQPIFDEHHTLRLEKVCGFLKILTSNVFKVRVDIL